MITQCCMQALYETNNQGAIGAAKEFERRRCNHNPKEPKSALECLASVVDVNGKNKHRYVLATQDIEIRRRLRRVPGVPLVYMNRSVMVMEPLSSASEKVSREMEKQKLYKGLNDPKFAGIVHDEKDEQGAESQNKPKKRKGPKEPNPLSMKKKKTEDSKPVSTSSSASASASASSGKKASTSEADDSATQSKNRRRRKHKKSGEEPETSPDTIQ